MFNWAKQQLANVAGLQEPIYGPDAIRSVAEEAAEVPYTELTREDFKWRAMDSTSVETQTWYFLSDAGDMGMAQVIYSNVIGLHTTAQFTAKVFSRDPEKPHTWSSANLVNTDFSEDKSCFYADSVAVELSEDGKSFTVKSMVDENCVVNIKVTRQTPAFQAGKTGSTYYGTDPAYPWGHVRHAFWPRCTSEGTITTKDATIDFTGRGFFAHALQGMKPHHAAAKWNFLIFYGPTYSAMLMEFTTPPSYDSTSVTVGAISRNDEIIEAGCDCRPTHLETEEDSLNDWPAPTAAKYVWAGKTKDGKPVEALLEGSLGERLDRIDVMAEVPGFVKKIVQTTAGTKPYIYQYRPSEKLTLKLKIGDEEIEETGEVFTEATFITE